MTALRWTAVVATPVRLRRLVLCPLRPADADEMVGVLSAPALYRFTGGEPPDAPALRRRYERLADGAPPGDTTWGNWIIRLLPDAMAIGTIQVTIDHSAPAHTVAELAWVVGQRWQRRRYAQEAADGMRAHLRAHGVLRLQARLHPRNHASAAVARSIGLRPRSLDGHGEEVWTNWDETDA